MWEVVGVMLGYGDPRYTCEAAMIASFALCATAYLLGQALYLTVFRRLHNSKQPYSFIQVSLISSDGIGALSMLLLASHFVLFKTEATNLTCLNPFRLYGLRAFFDVPAFAMLLTGSLLLLCCCVDRIQSLGWPNDYRVVDRSKRCLRINIFCYGLGWGYALMAHSLLLPVRTTFGPNVTQPSSTKDLVCLQRSVVQRRCSPGNVNFPVNFWLNHHLRELRACRLDAGQAMGLGGLLPSAPDVKLFLDLCLAGATLVLLKLYLRRRSETGASDSSSTTTGGGASAAKRHETSVCLALLLEALLSIASALPGVLHKAVLEPLMAKTDFMGAAMAVWAVGIVPQLYATPILLYATSTVFRNEFKSLPMFGLCPRWLHRYAYAQLLFLLPTAVCVAAVWVARYQVFGHLSCLL